MNKSKEYGISAPSVDKMRKHGERRYTDTSATWKSWQIGFSVKCSTQGSRNSKECQGGALIVCAAPIDLVVRWQDNVYISRPCWLNIMAGEFSLKDCGMLCIVLVTWMSFIKIILLLSEVLRYRTPSNASDLFTDKGGTNSMMFSETIHRQNYWC
jgi:hypothetical protein